MSSVRITFVALLLQAPICLAKKQAIAHYNKRRRYDEKEPVNVPVRFASASRCPGFSVGLSPKLSDVVKDGEVALHYAVNSDASLENIFGSEVMSVRIRYYRHSSDVPSCLCCGHCRYNFQRVLNVFEYLYNLNNKKNVPMKDVRTIFYFRKRGKPVQVDIQLQVSNIQIGRTSPCDAM